MNIATGSEHTMDVLVIDIGGSSVKLWHTGHQEHRKFESGKDADARGDGRADVKEPSQTGSSRPSLWACPAA